MNREELLKEQAEKEYYANQSAKIQTPYGGSLGVQPARPSLRERVESQLNHAQQEARKSERLHELSFLLEKHPEIARILDLLEDVRL